jgi:hypothetical protein
MKKCKTENPNISLKMLDSNVFFLEKNSVIPKPQIPSTPGPDYDWNVVLDHYSNTLSIVISESEIRSFVNYHWGLIV